MNISLMKCTSAQEKTPKCLGLLLKFTYARKHLHKFPFSKTLAVRISLANTIIAHTLYFVSRNVSLAEEKSCWAG